MINWEYEGLVLQTDGRYYYVFGGMIDWSFTGVVEQDGQVYMVQDGYVRWNVTPG